MDKLTTIGKIFFAIALIGLGSTHFIFEGFMTGRAPAWPEQLPGGLTWAYLSGTIFIMLGIAILAGKKAREAAIFAGILIFFWALLRHIPVIAADSILGVAWTAAGKALTFSGGALAIAATFPKVEGNRRTALLKFLNLKNEFILTGRICLGLFLINSGIQHFIFTEFVASLIPGWFPGDAVFWTYFAAVALIAGGNRFVHSPNRPSGGAPFGRNGLLVVLGRAYSPGVPECKQWNCGIRGARRSRHRVCSCGIFVWTKNKKTKGVEGKFLNVASLYQIKHQLVVARNAGSIC